MKTNFLLFAMLLISTLTYAVTGIDLPEAIPFDFNTAFVDGASLATTAVLIIDFLKNKFPKTFQGNFLKIFSYLSPVILAVLSWKMNWGFLAEYEIWWRVVLVGVMSSIGSYFLAYLGFANIILQALKIDLKGYRAEKRKG